MAVGGALLTLGLIQRWGEIFPRWLPLVGGKRVPPALAIVPASLVAAIVTSAGLMFVRLALFGPLPTDIADNWAALAPELLWRVWASHLARRRWPITIAIVAGVRIAGAINSPSRLRRA